MRIYFAGPLFSAAGHEVFLPQDQEKGKDAAGIFAHDVGGIDWADVLVAIMDGSDPDSGTAWECGYAYGKKPVVQVRTDFRAFDDPGYPYNPMLTGSATVVLELGFADMDAVEAAVLDALRGLEPD